MNDTYYVYVETKEIVFTKKFTGKNSFHNAITYSTKYQELDEDATVELLMPFE